jgi:hypothetical protein
VIAFGNSAADMRTGDPMGPYKGPAGVSVTVR